VPAPAGPHDTVRFGATSPSSVTGVRRYWIVGVDEVPARRHRIRLAAARAAGRKVGETIRLRAPRGEEQLALLAVDYPPDA
jgi:transcription elongation GreA/GreB family factor